MQDKLKESLQRDNATFININKSIVEFLCKCGKSHMKPKKAICNTSGAFCVDCTQRNTSIKKLQNRIAINNALLSVGEYQEVLKLTVAANAIKS